MSEDNKPATVSKDFDLFSDEFTVALAPTEADSVEGVQAEDVVPATVAPKGSPTTKVSRTVDLGDGSGKQVFSAATAEELLDVMTTAQENATKKIRQQEFELKRQSRAKPEKATVSNPSKELTADELFQLATELQKSPDAAIDKIMKAKTGKTMADLGAFISQLEAQSAVNAADTAFLLNHQDDFVPNKENAKSIRDFLQKEELPYTAVNLEYAFQELSESGLLDETPSNATTNDDKVDAKGQRIVVPEHTRRKPMSTGIRNGASTKPAVEDAKPGAMSESEVEQLYKMPIEEARVLMLKKMASASSGR